MPIPIELVARQTNPLADAKTTLSSWDNCMQKSYCKYPVIVVIVVGSLIVLSLLFCLARCLCCGLECCCGACACCNACCPSPRKKRDLGPSKFADSPGYHPPPYGGGGYQPASNPYVSPPAPQYARFDDPTRSAATETRPDALPHMPSWQTAESKRVPESHEMDKMGPHVGGAEEAPMLAHQAPDPHVEEPPHPYGPPSPGVGGAAAGGMYRGQQVTGGPSRSTTPQSHAAAYGGNTSYGGGNASYGGPYSSHSGENTSYGGGRTSYGGETNAYGGGSGGQGMPSALTVGGGAGQTSAPSYTAYSAYNPSGGQEPQHTWRDV